MKKFFTYALVALSLTLAGCYDDSALWSEIEDLDGRVTSLEEAVKDANNDIGTLQTLLNALQNQVTITSVTETANGYVILFSDGKKAEIKNGESAVAPVVSVKQDADGFYYWTIDGEWLIVDGNKVRATAQDGKDGADGEPGKDGIDGKDGSDAIAPQVRINPDTKMWEISIDGGVTWQSTGVVAQGRDGYDGSSGESYFKSVDITHPDYVTFVLYDGMEIVLPRYDGTTPSFIINEVSEVEVFAAGETKQYGVTAENVAEFSISKPDGWRVIYENDVITVTAPTEENIYAESAGVVAFNLMSENNKSLIVKMHVKLKEKEIRILTFEDADARFTPYTLDYAGVTVNTWSDLIDDNQYSGALTYGNGEYMWYDENNTELAHSFTAPYWGGGHAISNYVMPDYATLPEGHYGWYELQFSIPIGGYDGSSNFCVHNGYVDDFNASMGHVEGCQAITFADGVARVVDHMYVTNTNYVLNSLTYGDGFNSPAIETTYVKVLATGYDADQNSTGVAEFYLCKDGKCVTTWEKFDLSVLGEVVSIEFNFAASEDQSGAYGLNCPAYFAYDNVAVVF